MFLARVPYRFFCRRLAVSLAKQRNQGLERREELDKVENSIQRCQEGEVLRVWEKIRAPEQPTRWVQLCGRTVPLQDLSGDLQRLAPQEASRMGVWSEGRALALVPPILIILFHRHQQRDVSKRVTFQAQRGKFKI